MSDFMSFCLQSGDRTLAFKNISKDAEEYWQAKSDLNEISYTVSQPYPHLATTWIANRTADHLTQLLAGDFYRRRYNTSEEAMQGCAKDFELVQRVSQWIDHIRTSDPPHPVWKLRS